jgi:hypothetical protein
MASSTDEILRLTNGTIDVDLSMAFGPRVLRYAFLDGANLFASTPHLSTNTPLGPWRPVGGHRVWVAPERMPGSYAPDEQRLEYDVDGALGAELRAPVDAAGMQKTLQVRLDPAGTRVLVTHVIVNRTCWPVRIAPWAITIVDPAGTAVMPQPAFVPHADDFLPARRLVQWAYTDLADARWRIGTRLISLTPDPSKPSAQKIGAGNRAGWSALVRDDATFVKCSEWRAGEEYPDLGCSHEFFTAGNYLELETLGPLQLLEPGAAATHVETWHLTSAVRRGLDDATLERAIAGAIAAS